MNRPINGVHHLFLAFHFLLYHRESLYSLSVATIHDGHVSSSVLEHKMFFFHALVNQDDSIDDAAGDVPVESVEDVGSVQAPKPIETGIGKTHYIPCA